MFSKHIVLWSAAAFCRCAVYRSIMLLNYDLYPSKIKKDNLVIWIGDGFLLFSGVFQCKASEYFLGRTCWPGLSFVVPPMYAVLFGVLLLPLRLLVSLKCGSYHQLVGGILLLQRACLQLQGSPRCFWVAAHHLPQTNRKALVKTKNWSFAPYINTANHWIKSNLGLLLKNSSFVWWRG